MKLGRSLAVGSAAALLLLSFAAPAAFAYQGQVASQVTVTGPAGTIACNAPLIMTATVLDASGNPVAGQKVVWSLGTGQQAGDQVGTVSSTTNAAGQATTTITLTCTPADRTVVATANSATSQIVLGGGIFVLAVTATPAIATPVPAAPATAPAATATPAAGSPSSGGNIGTGNSSPPWILILLGLILLLLLLVALVVFIVRHGAAAAS
jgi:hypothetical protein